MDRGCGRVRWRRCRPIAHCSRLSKNAPARHKDVTNECSLVAHAAVRFAWSSWGSWAWLDIPNPVLLKTKWLLNLMVINVAIDKLSLAFGALSDPTRRAILARLAASGEATVGELAEPFDM